MSQLLHNSGAADRGSLPGCAAEARYAASYARDYRPPPDDVQLLFFSVDIWFHSLHGERFHEAPPCFL